MFLKVEQDFVGSCEELKSVEGHVQPFSSKLRGRWEQLGISIFIGLPVQVTGSQLFKISGFFLPPPTGNNFQEVTELEGTGWGESHPVFRGRKKSRDKSLSPLHIPKLLLVFVFPPLWPLAGHVLVANSLSAWRGYGEAELKLPRAAKQREAFLTSNSSLSLPPTCHGKIPRTLILTGCFVQGLATAVCLFGRLCNQRVFFSRREKKKKCGRRT